MSESPPSTTPLPTAGPQVRRFSARYLAVLAMVAVLVVVDQAVVQPLLDRLGEFAPIINVAGRQRMLSQRLSKAALAQQASHDELAWTSRRDELRTTLTAWRDAHASLRGDAPALMAPEIKSAWTELEPHFAAMGRAAEQLTAQSFTKRDDEAAAVAAMLDHEASYLRIMDRVVKLYEGEAAREVTWLRRVDLAIGATIVALLIGLGIGVIRPATRTIRRQVEDLERKVASRTAELRTANAALRHEIADREAAQADQQRLAAQLAHAARVSTMGHLTAGLAHELNQPLSAIANFAAASEVIVGQLPERPAPLGDHLRQIELAALRAGQIVRRMRNFVRPQRGSPAIAALDEIMREVLALCGGELSHAEIDCRVESPADLPVVCVDRVEIQQVLVNLVQNAVDAMRASPPGRRRLLLRVTPIDQELRIEVHDDGAGFSSEVLPHLFQPFQTTKAGGLGIGLSIARSIVEQHHGRIWAGASDARLGAVVAFTLPSTTTHDAPCDESAVRLCCGR